MRVLSQNTRIAFGLPGVELQDFLKIEFSVFLLMQYIVYTLYISKNKNTPPGVQHDLTGVAFHVI